MSRCPVYPKPQKHKLAGWLHFFKKRNSLLDGLYERSYRMKMGLVRLPGIKFFIINQPEQVKQVMIDEVADFPKHPLQADILRPLLGDSIFTTNGAVWRRQRDMLDVAFDNRQVERVYSAMQDATQNAINRLQTHVGGPAFDIDREMTLVTADIIFRAILSTQLETEKGMEILEAFERFQRASPKFALLEMFGLKLRWLQPLLDRKRLADAAIIRGAIAEVIRPRFEASQRGESDAHGDILAQVLGARDASGVAFSFEEVVDQVCMLFLAGHETSASALTWSLYLMAITPDECDAARTEVVQAVGADTRIRLPALKALKSVQRIFMEALRLYPPVGFFPRQSLNTTQVRDKQVGAGDCVVASPWLLQRHEDLWDDPHAFCPARFDPSVSERKPPQYAYIPFGVGERVCIGAAFARQEAVLILAEVLRAFEIRLEPGFEPQPVGRLTIRSENGLRVQLRARAVSCSAN